MEQRNEQPRSEGIFGSLLRSLRLDNGLIIEFYDHSNRYFGDYHRVCVEACCRVPVTPEWFATSVDSDVEFRTAQAVLGHEAVFIKRLERMGVAGAAMAEAREDIIESFIRSSVAYLSSGAFPSRFIAAELRRRREGRRLQWAGQ